MRYEFGFPQGKVTFDFENGVIELEGKTGREENGKLLPPIRGTYPFEELPLFTSFYLTAVTTLFDHPKSFKARLYMGRAGFVLELIRLKEPKDGKVAFLLARDLHKPAATKFSFNRPNLYAFLKMLEERDKLIPVEDTVWEKRSGRTFVNRLEVPFQKTKALRYALEEFLRGSPFPIRQVWDEGQINLTPKRLEVFQNNRPLATIPLGVDNVARILSCL